MRKVIAICIIRRNNCINQSQLNKQTGEIVILKEKSKDGTMYHIDPEDIENISVVYGVVTKEGKELKGPAIVKPKVGIVC